MKDTSQTLSLDSEDIPFLDRREAEALGVTLFTAHWSLLVPTLVLAVVFAILWYALTVTGQSATLVGRFFIVAMAVLFPLLAATAFLRLQTTRVQIGDDVIAIHEGNLMGQLKELEPSSIDSISIKPTLFGGGTLLIESNSETIAILRNLSNPDLAKQEILKNKSEK